MRTRISIGLALCAVLLGCCTGVELWGIGSGPDGKLWFTEDNNNAVGRITPAAVITEFTAGFTSGNPRGIVTG